MISDGFLVVDKPPGVTSHDVVAIVRNVTGLKKVGHTGTLDPFATGVLPLALGGATRLIAFLDEREKVYDATVVLGSQTDTGDPTGTVVAEAAVPVPRRERVEAVLAAMVGEREQTPPRYSAVKIAGRPLYDYARAGQEVEAKARRISIHAMDLLGLEAATIRVRIRCSRGTYARVIAEEIGVALGTVAHLGDLRREASGPFTLESAVSMSRLSSIVAGLPEWVRVLRPQRGDDRVAWRERAEVVSGLQPWMIPAATALGHLQKLALSPIELRRLLTAGTAPPLTGTGATVLMDGREVVGVVAPGQRPVVLAREGEPPPRRATNS
ncbi:MAG: tRNA pseudouridine(55) synthase TruB [Deltaproteobacteria bacterium]|nr:tRNA pseudouridine(55) synthase TruB [Deltaproteobacteria bacterium]